jgi:hypothetical protein
MSDDMVLALAERLSQARDVLRDTVKRAVPKPRWSLRAKVVRVEVAWQIHRDDEDGTMPSSATWTRPR